MRKKDKLPAERYSQEFQLEYGKATIEIHKDSLKPKERVIVVDDLIATGGTSDAAGVELLSLGGGGWEPESAPTPGPGPAKAANPG